MVQTLVALSTAVQAADQLATESPRLDLQLPFWNRTAPAVFRAKFETNKGHFILEAHRAWAPRGVDRLILSAAASSTTRVFLRVRPGFIAQFGIAGQPAIATRWNNEKITDDPVQQSNARGFVAYAMTGPDTRTTQLFINLSDNSRLDYEGFAPLGRVIEGMEIVDALYGGYGEDAGGGMRGGKQQRLLAEGNQYLDRESRSSTGC